MFSRAEILASQSTGEILPGLKFPIDKRMDPEMLKLYFPDYALFRQLPIVHPVLWGKLHVVPFKSAEKHVIAFLGPSAAGKDTILHSVEFPPYTQIITHTTRTDRTDSLLTEKYIYIDQSQFDILNRNHKLIEWISQTAGFYGTTIMETEKALQSGNQIIVWRGEETGLPKIWEWLENNHPEIERHVAFVLPKMSLVELAARIIEKRGIEEAKGRVQKAIQEIKGAGTIADFLILNPPERNGPYNATMATQKLFMYVSGR